jgi:V-type H+-transporting ATPase subunit E
MSTGGRESDSQRQVKQMVNFIMQEAQEKASELRIKTDHDFNLEKQQLVHNGKLKIQEEYAQKQKDLEIQQRVARSTALAVSRVRKMKARDDLLEQLKVEATARLASICAGPEYANLLRQLIIQGLIKIEESVVEIQARAEDKAIVTRVLPEAVAEFRRIMGAAGFTVDPRVTICEHSLASKAISGGVILTALRGRIVLNQTVDERLEISYSDMMPSVRYGLFPEK